MKRSFSNKGNRNTKQPKMVEAIEKKRNNSLIEHFCNGEEQDVEYQNTSIGKRSIRLRYLHDRLQI